MLQHWVRCMMAARFLLLLEPLLLLCVELVADYVRGMYHRVFLQYRSVPHT